MTAAVETVGSPCFTVAWARSAHLVFLAILLAGCAVAARATSPAQESTATPPGPPVRADRPTYKLGDRWIRSDGVFELIRVEPDRYVFSGGVREEIHLSRDLVPMRYASHTDTWEFRPSPKIGWPLEIGKRGSAWGTVEVANGQAGPAILTWAVLAYEDVQVPAGTFKAFRVAFDMRLGTSTDFGRPQGGPGPRTQWIYTSWYAPEARQWIKTQSHNAWELRFEVVAVDPEEAAPLQITLRNPEDQAQVSWLDGLEVTGRVTGGKGVARVTVSLNGETVFAEAAKGKAKKTILLQVPFKTLREGKNLVLVTAADGAGATSQEARTLFYTAPVKVELPPPGQQARVAQENILLRGRVSHEKGVGWFNISLNGGVRVWESGRGQVEVPFDLPLTLSEGENIVKIRIGSESSGGAMRDEVRTLVLEKIPPASVPAAPAGSVPPVAAAAEKPRPATSTALAEPPAAAEPEPPAATAAAPSQAPQSKTPSVSPMDPAAAKREPLPPHAAEAPAPTSVPPAVPPVAVVPRAPEPPVAGRPTVEPETPPAAKPPAREPSIAASQPPIAEKLQPFELRISAPEDRLRVEQETIALAALAAGGRGVSRVVVMLNGIEVSRSGEGGPRRSIATNLPVKLRDGQNTIVVTATEADGTAHQEVRTVQYEKSVPLALEVRYPPDQLTVTQPSSVIVAHAIASNGVARVSVTVNGKEIETASQAAAGARDIGTVGRAGSSGAGPAGERGPPKTVAVSAPVTLAEGGNVIVVTAVDSQGVTRQEVRTVTYDKPRIAVAPPLPPPPAATRWAVVVGVGEYQSPGIPKLNYTVQDAEAIYRVLTGPGGFKKEHVLLLTDRAERKPTLRNVKWALGTFLARSARKDDTVLIFFAGHGAPEVDARGMERDGLAKYLIPNDADPDDLFSSALPMDDINTIFGRIEAERIVAFLDTCYSGSAGGRTFVSKKTRTTTLDDQFLERLTRSKGRAIITASRPSEVSMELPELGHGIFTYYLVEGLKGAADGDRDGVVTLQELYEYVEREVTRKARAVGGNQHPVMKGELEGALPLLRVLRP